MKKSILLIIILLSGAAQAQVIPSVGVAAELDQQYITWSVEIVRGEEHIGISTTTGAVHGDVQILVGVYFKAGEHSLWEARAGFHDTYPAINAGYKHFIGHWVLGADIVLPLEHSPAIGIKTGFLIGDIHYRRR